MKISININFLITALIIINLILLSLGNFIFTTTIPLIAKILISEFCFICIYTIVDKGNIKYKYKFTIPMVLVSFIFVTPISANLFYSFSVQILSVSIFIIAIVINSIIINKLVSKGFVQILCSRISTTIATLFEVGVFSILLEIGLKGLIITLGVRAIYIYAIPQMVFIRIKPA